MSGRDLLSLAFRVLSALFFAVAIGLIIHVLLFLRTSDRVDGVVVSVSTVSNSIRFTDQDDPTGMLYYPVVEYQADNVSYQVTGRRGTSEPHYRVGDVVGVIYASGAPADARLDTFMGVWGSAVVLVACGVVFLIISVLAPFGFGGNTNEDQR